MNASNEKIMTLHPDASKQGVNIDRAKYDTVRDAIVSLLEQRGEMTYTDLADAVGEVLTGNFEGSIQWYTVTVKLDLEARGVIERVPRTTPHRVRLV